MRRLFALFCLIALAACAPAEQEEAPPAQMEAPAVTLADFAGNWSMQALNASGDSVLISYQMMATDQPTGWMMMFPNRDPVPATATLAGDSVMIHAGPYTSALRNNLQVTVDAVTRLTNGQLTGTFTARYNTSGPDSILRGRQRGTRMP